MSRASEHLVERALIGVPPLLLQNRNLTFPGWDHDGDEQPTLQPIRLFV